MLSHALETTALPEELWPALEAFARSFAKHRIIESAQTVKLVWEVQGIGFRRRWEATLGSVPLGCRLSLRVQALGLLAWLFNPFCRRRWQRELMDGARRLARQAGRC